MALKLRPRDECAWDALALGEVMLRLDPGDAVVRSARQFRVWEGGGEYNVVRALRRCFGLRTAVVTALVDNDVGRLLEDLMLQGGVDLSLVRWLPFDGVGREARNGLYFVDRGFGVRGAVATMDRGHAAASKLARGDVDWEDVFGRRGARWFHTGGIFAALSETTPDVLVEAMECARAHGTLISYDLNYRPSLWKAVGGPERAIEVNRRVAPLVDVMIGNEEDFTAALGFEVEGVDESFAELDTTSFQRMIARVVKEFPNFQAVATTLRQVKPASVNDWGAILWCGGEFHTASERRDLEIYDRVGGGDSFASGLVYGFLSGRPPAECVEWGAAHGALAMTTPGDTSMATLKQVQKLVGGGSARVDR
jgi:2-dehydro-3-deoxygluconokinase